MDREDFVFKRSWFENVGGLQPRVRLDVYEAIISYSLNGTVGRLGQAGRAAFMPIKKEIDVYNAWLEKREDISMKRREAGRKGAMVTNHLPRQNSAKHAFDAANELESSQKTQSLTRAISNQDNIDDNKNIISKKKKENAEKKDKEGCNQTAQSSMLKAQSAREFIAFFNSTLDHAGAVIPHRCAPTEKRVQAVLARRREYGEEALKTMVEKAAASDFLNGRNNRGWVATLDWMLRPNNFPKVIEGNYDNRAAVQNSKSEIQNSNSNENRKYYDRRGTDASWHSPDEY